MSASFSRDPDDPLNLTVKDVGHSELYGKLGRGEEAGGDTLDTLIHHWPTSGRSPVLSFLSNPSSPLNSTIWKWKEEEDKALSTSTSATYFLAAFIVVLPYRTTSAYWCPLV